jgi:hypothetical protein
MLVDGPVAADDRADLPLPALPACLGTPGVHHIVTRAAACATHIYQTHGSRRTAMKPIRLLLAMALAAAPALAVSPSPALAANADAPYQNVDHSNDKGNDTGDSQVDGLNKGQLNGNYTGPVQMRTPATAPPAVVAPVVQAPSVPVPAVSPPR